MCYDIVRNKCVFNRRQGNLYIGLFVVLNLTSYFSQKHSVLYIQLLIDKCSSLGNASRIIAWLREVRRGKTESFGKSKFQFTQSGWYLAPALFLVFINVITHYINIGVGTLSQNDAVL